MTSSASSRSSLSSAALAALALGAAACASGRGATWPGHPDSREPVRVAVLPPENLSGRAVPGPELGSAVEQALAREGVDVVGGAILDEFLARHRVRDTSGLPEEVAAAARRELGVSGVLVTSILLYTEAHPPRFGLAMRLVSTEEEPQILWTDGFGRTGDDAPGLLGLGRIADVATLEREALKALGTSLGTFLRQGGPRAPRCPSTRTFAPAIAYRSPALARKPSLTVAVLPFQNQSGRGAAGQAVALQVIRQLLAHPGVRVVEPGTLRDRMLEYRITTEGGASLDAVRILAKVVPVDLMVGGVVRDYASEGSPLVGFTLLAIDPRSEELVWESTSSNRGDDATTLFGVGAVSTADGLACRMARAAVDRMLERRTKVAEALR